MRQDATSSPTAGWDWASDSHVLAVVDRHGVETARRTVDHTEAGLGAGCRWLERHGVSGVAVERPDGPVIRRLLDADHTVVVIPPRQVAKLRGRYGSAGNKDDHFDAFVLADVLRTDAARLTALQPDTDDTVALRTACRARDTLVDQRIAVCNQLQAHLDRVFPGAVGLFSQLWSPISLAFLDRFPTAEKAGWLSPKRLGNWLAGQGYTGGKDPHELFDRLCDAPAGITGQAAQMHGQVTRAYVDTIDVIQTRADDLEADIDKRLELHPDGHIFTSFPRSGRFRAARLLAEIGDCRARFPTPESLQGLAGVVPSTRQSGGRRVVAFRYACDKPLRNALCDFVGDSRRVHPWAAKIYRDARDRDKTHPHAIRILARSWSYVIWRCWQDQTPYDPAHHRGLQQLLATTTSQAA